MLPAWLARLVPGRFKRVGRAGQPVKSAIFVQARRLTAPYINILPPAQGKLPSFFIIGTQRGGSSALYDCLANHPQVCPSLYKEAHFFDIHYHRGEDWYRRNFYKQSYIDRLDRESGSPHHTLDATPDYLYHPLVPARLKALLPEAKLIVLLRHPVERAISHHGNELRKQYETLPFEQAIAAEEERLRGEAENIRQDERYFSYRRYHYSYIDRGRYDVQLENWLKFFPREKFYITSSEDLFSRSDAVIAEITDFLGLKRLEGRGLERFNEGTHKSVISPALRQQLMEAYAPHIQRLSQMTGVAVNWS